MLYVYPDNFIVPVIFTNDITDKKHKKQKHVVEEIGEERKEDAKEKFRDDGKEKYYDKLQEKFAVEWNVERESAQEMSIINILDEIDKEYAYNETEKI